MNLFQLLSAKQGANLSLFLFLYIAVNVKSTVIYFERNFTCLSSQFYLLLIPI